ncbi:hypothetical protein D3C72_2203060 [compost metagenome]
MVGRLGVPVPADTGLLKPVLLNIMISVFFTAVGCDCFPVNTYTLSEDELLDTTPDLLKIDRLGTFGTIGLVPV